MAVSRAIPITILAGVLVTAHFALGWQAEKNGTFTLPMVFSYDVRTLPGTTIPIKLPQTGIAFVDNYFAFMMTFFWAALDQRNVRAHLQAFYLISTLSGTFLLMVSEAHQSAHSATFLLLTYFFELMGEALGIGMFTPVWCIVHLVMTNVPKPGSKSDAETILSAPKGGIQALGYAIAIGHAVPHLLMFVTEIDTEGLLSQQLWTILRLFHPVFVLVLYAGFRAVQGSIDIRDEPSVLRLANKHKIYLFAALVSACGHVASLGVLFSQHWIRDWLRPDVLAALDWRTIILPAPFWSKVELVPFVTGVATFLQWDNICSASAIFIWASSLYSEALLNHVPSIGLGGIVNMGLQTASVTLLAGPVAGAAFMLHERDAVIVAFAGQKDKKKQ